MKPIRFYIFLFLLSFQNAYGCEIGNDDIFSVTKGNQTCNFTALQICSSFLETIQTEQNDNIDKLATAANSTAIAGNVALIVAGTTALFYTIKDAPGLWRKVISPAWSKCFKKTGSEVLDIGEVLPDTMDEIYISHLTDFDETLTESTLTTKADKNSWRKFPIYGRFRDHRNSWIGCLDCRKCKKPKDNCYLYGFFYENGTYKVEIEKLFSVKPPHKINFYKFYAIHEIYKKRSKGIKKEPRYSPLLEESFVESASNAPTDEKEKKLSQHTDEVVIELKENLFSVDPAENDPLKKNSHRKKEETAIPHKRLNFNTLKGVDLDAVEDFIQDFIKDNVALQDHFPSKSLRHDPLESLFKLRKGNSKKGKLPDYRIQFALVSNDKKLSTHLYCLFPTVPQGKENNEEYKILLHIKRVEKRFPFYTGSIPDDVQFLRKASDNLLHFRLTEVKPDGDCGFGAIETTRQDSLKLLEEAEDYSAVNDEYVRKLVAPDVLRSWREGLFPEGSEISKKFTELGKKYDKKSELQDMLALIFSEEHGFKEGQRKAATEILEDDSNIADTVDLKKNDKKIGQIRSALSELAREKETYLAYIELFKNPPKDSRDWLVHTPTKGKVDQELGTTGLYDAIAYLMRLNLYIWQLSEDKASLTLIHQLFPQ